jgi:hypothetical protein
MCIMTDSVSPTPPPRGELFTDPAARVIWPAIIALPEAVKHDVLKALGNHLALSHERDTPHGQRVARAVAALREAYDLHVASGGVGPLSVERYRELRQHQARHGWPPDASVRRWLGGSWNDALKSARLETVPDGDALKVHLGGAITAEEAITALRLCAEQLGRIPTFNDYLHWCHRDDVIALPGRRPQSQPPFDRIFGGWTPALSAAALIETTAAGAVSPNYSLRPGAYRYTREQVGEALSACAQTLGRSPRSAEYMRWRAEELRDSTRQPTEHVARPSYAVIHRIFASWDAALSAAGLQPLGGRSTRSNERTRRTDGYRYTEQQLLEAVRDAHEAMGWPLTGKAYGLWHKQQLDALRAEYRPVHRVLPSYSALVSRFTSWTEVLRRAIDQANDR